MAGDNLSNNLIGCIAVWQRDLVDQCLKVWLSQPEAKQIKSLPLIVVWSVWLARNRALFNDSLNPVQVTVPNSLAIMEAFKQIKKGPKIREIIPKVIDKTSAWAFFNGASKGDAPRGELVVSCI